MQLQQCQSWATWQKGSYLKAHEKGSVTGLALSNAKTSHLTPGLLLLESSDWRASASWEDLLSDPEVHTGRPPDTRTG